MNNYLSFLVLGLIVLSSAIDTPELLTKKIQEEYDFIIVGAGSAGSALVNRLSEIKKWKILLLEAGGEPGLTTDVPLLAALALFSDQNWGYNTEKGENFALGLRNQQVHWPRGKGLGGSSLLNYMCFSRGAPQDYDNWASLGNPGWSYEDVLPHLKNLENCKIKHQDYDYRGHNGELHVEDSYGRSKAADIFIEAAKSLGYKYLDFNGKEHVGVSYMQSTTINGLRCSGERCFLRKCKERNNLTIRINSHVTKVLIGKAGRAEGIEFVKNDKKYKAYARKEIILSSGSINSAQTLMLSGIGPKKQLENLNIKVIHDLPVGQKIYDHQSFFGLGFYSESPLNLDAKVMFDDKNYVNLYKNGESPLHNLGGIEAVVFANTELAETKNLSDIEIIYWSTHVGSYEDFGLGRSLGLSEKIYDKIFRPYRDQHIFSTLILLLHPESYGRMELKSSNPFEHPKLYAGYFSDPNNKDIKVLTAGIRETLKIFSAEPFQKHGVKPIEIPIPGCEQFKFGSDEYWECAIRHLSTTTYHQTTTCKMGPKNDPEAVVDHRLRVYGVDGLRVADASVIPVQITGHTNVPAYVVGEKAASILIEEYSLRNNQKEEL
nr:glucose dehydrogenase [FAD, quinone]-like [Onthophagus taurus]